jgi:hypothetical protein
VTRVIKPIGVFNEILMDVLVYETQYDLMYALARFQEFHENPLLHGQVFSRQKLQTWQHDYYIRWNGCNFPATVVEAMRGNPDAWQFDGHELEALRHMRPDMYIVGLHLKSDFRNVLLHERAHALYASKPSYRNMVHDVIREESEKEAFNKLRDMGYGDNVLHDEYQAYTVHGWEEKLPGIPVDLKLRNHIRRYYGDLLLLED